MTENNERRNEMILVNVDSQEKALLDVFKEVDEIFLFAKSGRACLADAARLQVLSEKIKEQIGTAAELIAKESRLLTPAQVKPGDKVVVFSDDGSAVLGRFSYAEFS